MTENTTSRRFDGRADPPPDLVERLVSLAERGPEIPPDGAARVKSAIRPAWRAEVRRRSRRNRLWAGAGLAVAACLVLTLVIVLRDQGPGAQSPVLVANLVVVKGDVDVLPADGSPLQVTEGSSDRELYSGSWLRTGPTSRAALELAGGESLRLDADSRALLVSAREVNLDRGAVYVDSGGDSGTGLVVKTSIGIAREIGTQFMVRRAGTTLAVHVREGLVALSHDGQQIQVTPETFVEISADGSMHSGATKAHGPEWAWMQEVTPPFEIEGRSVIAFLDWVSRETGLWVCFPDAEVESFAASTVLHGSIQGLAPAEAPAVVLPGCGLEVTVTSGTLTVER